MMTESFGSTASSSAVDTPVRSGRKVDDGMMSGQGETVRMQFVSNLRARLNLATDYDRGLRERWVRGWADALPSGSVVLDAGAGDAHMAAAFSRHRYVGIDIRPKSTEANTPLISGDLHHLPIRLESVDHATAIEVLEHVRHPEKVLVELAGCLRPGGSLCVSVPQAGGEHERPFDFFRFTTFSLSAMAEDAGLEVERITMKGGYFRRLSSEIRDLPFTVLPEAEIYRFKPAATALRWVLVTMFTFIVATLLVPLDRFDRARTYTTGYFCIFRKPAAGRRPTPSAAG